MPQRQGAKESRPTAQRWVRCKREREPQNRGPRHARSLRVLGWSGGDTNPMEMWDTTILKMV